MFTSSTSSALTRSSGEIASSPPLAVSSAGRANSRPSPPPRGPARRLGKSPTVDAWLAGAGAGAGAIAGAGAGAVAASRRSSVPAAGRAGSAGGAGAGAGECESAAAASAALGKARERGLGGGGEHRVGGAVAVVAGHEYCARLLRRLLLLLLLLLHRRGRGRRVERRHGR
jgi:hypothetical protein